MGNLNRVRELSTQVNQYFCLPEEMWLEWLKDEIMCQGAGEGAIDVLALFEQSLTDYLYEKVCYKYIKFIVKNKNTIAKEVVEAAFEKVVRVYGLGGQRACKIWRLYIENTENKEEIA